MVANLKPAVLLAVAIAVGLSYSPARSEQANGKTGVPLQQHRVPVRSILVLAGLVAIGVLFWEV
jgi:hypothetical protein